MNDKNDRTKNATSGSNGSLVTHTCLILSLGFMISFGPQAVLRAQGTEQGSNPASVDSPPSPATSPASQPEEYLINPNDSLDIFVYDVPELSHTYTVSPSGVVSMPLLSLPIQAAGLTADQFARSLEEAYRQSGRLQRPEIAVSVKQSPASSVAVEGAVKNPTILSAVGRVKLVDVITQCGGLTDDSGATATITHGAFALRELSAGGALASPVVTVDLKKVMDVTDPASTTAVWPGDRVVIERQAAEVYYVLGEVRSPGGYTLRRGQSDLTVLRALALAGDATGVAKKSKAMIIRKDPKGAQGRDEIKLDLKSILVGKSPDPVLQADDILFVPGSTGKKALKTLESTPAMVVGGAAEAAVIAH